MIWPFCDESAVKPQPTNQPHFHATYYYYNRFMALRILSGTSWVSRYQKDKTRKVKLIWIYWSKR